jgi:hypothetical protein
MSRWTGFLWQALAALGEADITFDYPCLDQAAGNSAPDGRRGDLSDGVSVNEVFRAIVEREWGSATFTENPAGGGCESGLDR